MSGGYIPMVHGDLNLTENDLPIRDFPILSREIKLRLLDPSLTKSERRNLLKQLSFARKNTKLNRLARGLVTADNKTFTYAKRTAKGLVSKRRKELKDMLKTKRSEVKDLVDLLKGTSNAGVLWSNVLDYPNKPERAREIFGIDPEAAKTRRTRITKRQLNDPTFINEHLVPDEELLDMTYIKRPKRRIVKSKKNKPKKVQAIPIEDYQIPENFVPDDELINMTYINPNTASTSSPLEREISAWADTQAWNFAGNQFSPINRAAASLIDYLHQRMGTLMGTKEAIKIVQRIRNIRGPVSKTTKLLELRAIRAKQKAEERAAAGKPPIKRRTRAARG